jgi:formate dehydrogenase iron-sulfur subunit
LSEKAFLIDVSRCTACRGCQVACKEWNKLPAETTNGFGGPGYQNPPDLSAKTLTLIYFREVEANGEFRWLFRKHQCMHCTNAVCAELCPVGAVQKHETGFAIVDESKCIGCEVCQKFCPFEAARRDDKTRKLSICKFCIDRVTNDLMPACAKTCSNGAIQFGDRQAMLAQARQVCAASTRGPLRIYGEREMGGLHVLYILRDDPVRYGLPYNPRMPDPMAVYSFLQKTLGSQPNRDAILAAAAVKYFGNA